jgi:hypothetical protein
MVAEMQDGEDWNRHRSNEDHPGRDTSISDIDVRTGDHTVTVQRTRPPDSRARGSRAVSIWHDVAIVSPASRRIAMDIADMAAGVAAYGLVEGDPRLATAPLRDDEWQELVALCRRERLVFLLDAAIRGGAVQVTEEQRDELGALFVPLVQQQLHLEAQLRMVIRILEPHRLDYRVLKGPALANTVYGDPQQRYFHDIDLLVRTEQLSDVVRVLTAEAGYRRRGHELRPGFDRRFAKSVTMLDRLGGELDLHRTLVRGVCGFQLDLDDLWESSRPVSVAGVTVKALSPEHQTLHAAMVAALSDVPPRLSALRDVAQLASVDAVGANRLAILAAHHRVVVPVAQGVLLTERGLQISLGELGTWAAGVDVDAEGRRQLAEYGADGRYRQQALDIARTLSWPDRIRYLSALAVPSREFLRDQGVGRLAWLRGVRNHDGPEGPFES